MKCYDYIIAGSGCSGLSLAYYLSQSPLKNRRVLLIDRVQKSENDRTWCFWTRQPTAFDAIVKHSWQYLTFADDQGKHLHRLRKHQYQLIKGIDFYQFTQAAIAQQPNFEYLQGDISYIGEDERGAFATVDGEQYRADWVFNSCFDWRAWQAQNVQHHFLLQHFKGWIVETTEPVFDTKIPTLMDFRAVQQGNARFFYVLPLAENRALVEYTVFSEHLLSPSEYQTELKNHLQQQLGITQYAILEEEYGVIPMTDALLPQPTGKRIIQIGTVGGAVKPTTGYAFLKIQKQAQQIVQQLEQGRVPKPQIACKSRFRFYDQLLLNILTREGNLVKPIFSHLFRNNPIERIFAFLDERTTLWQELQIFARLPMLPFLRAIYRLYMPKRKVMAKVPELSALNDTIK